MDELFAPPSENWVRLSPNYAKLKRIMVVINWTIFFAIPIVLTAIFLDWWVPVLIGLAWLAVLVWRLLRMGRMARSWGYSERETDLYITHGLWFKNLTIVPYGRMQQVNVTSGPIERRFGLASIELVTASSASNAGIPGLTPEQAAGLRDRLSHLGEAQASGL